MSSQTLPPPEGPEYTPCGCGHIGPQHRPDAGPCLVCDCTAYQPAVLPAAPVPPTTHATDDTRRARLAAAMREHYLCTDREEADADRNSPCRCGDWREPGAEADDENDWDSHLADVMLDELRRMADEAQQQPDTETPGCPDPIECSHEAALGQAREEIRRLGLMVDEYGQGASALTDKLKQVRDRHRETCPWAQGKAPSPAFRCGMCDVLDAPAMPVRQPASGPGRVADEEPAETPCRCVHNDIVYGRCVMPALHDGECFHERQSIRIDEETDDGSLCSAEYPGDDNFVGQLCGLPARHYGDHRCDVAIGDGVHTVLLRWRSEAPQ